MAAITVWRKLDEEHATPALQELGKQLDGSSSELVLDFGDMHRIDAGFVQQLEAFISIADEKKVRVALHGVNVDVYKVLKLLKLTSRFTSVS